MSAHKFSSFVILGVELLFACYGRLRVPAVLVSCRLAPNALSDAHSSFVRNTRAFCIGVQVLVCSLVAFLLHVDPIVSVLLQTFLYLGIVVVELQSPRPAASSSPSTLGLYRRVEGQRSRPYLSDAAPRLGHRR